MTELETIMITQLRLSQNAIIEQFTVACYYWKSAAFSRRVWVPLTNHIVPSFCIDYFEKESTTLFVSFLIPIPNLNEPHVL